MVIAQHRRGWLGLGGNFRKQNIGNPLRQTSMGKGGALWPAGQPCIVVGFRGVDHARHLWSTYRAQGRAAPVRALVPRCCTLTHGQEHEAIVQAAMDVEVRVPDGSVALSAWWHVA
jgi:hypothetical protein